MVKIKVNLGNRSYDIKIGKGILFKTDFSKYKASKYAIITDSNVRRLYGEDLQSLLIKQGLDSELIDFPAGEKSKTWEQAGDLGRELAQKGYDRDSIIIALGGGVVGDMAGFIASFYERGISYIQIPTTLLAQVDSSVGGKTGVDIKEGKNILGYFYQPLSVIIDINTLKTLPEKEIRNGLVEIIKYGMIQDSELFEYLEKNPDRNDGFYLKIIEKSCKIKAKIVGQDEKEEGFRKILNYGHTIGHAIETAKRYKIPHGEAISLGMVHEGKISFKLGLLNNESLQRQNKLIHNGGHPVKYKGDPNKLIEIMKRDKKTRFKKLHFILPTSIGKVLEEKGKIAFPVDESFIKECLNE